jgi:phosphomannomutase / phosphoglucomutase
MFLDAMAKQNIPTYFSVCHHNSVIENIIKRGAVFGGEITFHFFFPLDYYLADDAVFSALKLAQSAAEKDNFIDFVDSLPVYCATPEIFIDCSDEQKAGKISKFISILREREYSFIDVDGARVNLPEGWALARFSNTEPRIKCRFEADSKENLKKVVEEILPLLSEAGIEFSQQNIALLGV